MNSGLALAAEGGKWKRYPAYRDSGVEWLGAVPERWSSSAVKHNYTIQLGKMLQNKPDSDEDILVPYAKALYVLWGNVVTDDLPKMWANPSDIQQYGIEGGDLLVCEGGEVGRAGVVTSPPEQCIIQNALHRARAKKSSEVYFLQYVLHAVSSSTWFDVLCNKATIAHFTREKFADLGIPVPPLPEQRTIATFLDHETGRIDALIAKKERQIELLQEKRTALISHAVTKGLDPDAPMKDSGVEWLGAVPEHWNIVHLKRVFHSTDYGISESLRADGVYGILRMGDIQDGEILMDDLGYVDSVAQELLLNQGDLVFNRTNSLALVGKVGIFRGTIEDNISFASYLVRLRIKDASDPEYFNYMLNRPEVLVKASSMALPSIGQANLNPNRYGYLRICAPPKKEQDGIARFLRDKTCKIDQLKEKINGSTNKLREYRTALISATVTGKIDVRGELAP